MRNFMKGAAIWVILALPAWAAPAARNYDTGTDDATEQQLDEGAANASQDAPAANPNAWRYKRVKGQWLYLLPSNRWVIWTDNKWMPYDPATMGRTSPAVPEVRTRQIEQYAPQSYGLNYSSGASPSGEGGQTANNPGGTGGVSSWGVGGNSATGGWETAGSRGSGGVYSGGGGGGSSMTSGGQTAGSR
jgi:hypothetical protein